MLRAAYRGKLDGVKAAINDGANVNIMPDDIGLTALHMAIGRGYFDIVKFLVEQAGAAIQPDSFGRWPTIIAAQCKASTEICDYIVAREAELTNVRQAVIDE